MNIVDACFWCLHRSGRSRAWHCWGGQLAGPAVPSPPGAGTARDPARLRRRRLRRGGAFGAARDPAFAVAASASADSAAVPHPEAAGARPGRPGLRRCRLRRRGLTRSSPAPGRLVSRSSRLACRRDAPVLGATGCKLRVRRGAAPSLLRGRREAAGLSGPARRSAASARATAADCNKRDCSIQAREFSMTSSAQKGVVTGGRHGRAMAAVGLCPSPRPSRGGATCQPAGSSRLPVLQRCARGGRYAGPVAASPRRGRRRGERGRGREPGLLAPSGGERR